MIIGVHAVRGRDADGGKGVGRKGEFNCFYFLCILIVCKQHEEITSVQWTLDDNKNICYITATKYGFTFDKLMMVYCCEATTFAHQFMNHLL